MNMDQENAVIYCRSANYAHGIDNDDLAQQREHCIARANEKGYKVLEVFSDMESGNQAERPGLNTLLAYLKESRQVELPVLIDGPSRLARNLGLFIKLSSAIREAGGSLDMPGLELEHGFSTEAKDKQEKREG